MFAADPQPNIPAAIHPSIQRMPRREARCMPDVDVSIVWSTSYMHDIDLPNVVIESAADFLAASMRARPAASFAGSASTIIA